MTNVAFILAFVLVAQTPTGRLHGRVLDPLGAVLVATPVVLTGAAGRVVETRTDGRGVYAFDDLTPGTYVVTIDVPGFTGAQRPVTIVGGGDRALDIRLTLAVQRERVEVVAEPPAGAATDPASNASATVIKGRDLDALSDDPNELEAQLHALAGPGAGQRGAQIFVDGFTGGRLPPKGAIQEIRINQNPYSAEFDTLGAGRIEIITRPGSQTPHGRYLFDGNTAAWNTRNPFLPAKPPHHSVSVMGTTSGPLGPAAAFVVSGEVQAARETSAVNAVILDPSLNPVRFSQAVANPQTAIVLNPRVDLQPSRTNTLSVRYRFEDDRDQGNGVGQLSLASQAFEVSKTEHDVQVNDLQVLSARLMNDARFEYRSFQTTQAAGSAAPQVTVLGAFTGGGSSLGSGRTLQRHVEVHDYLSGAFGAHTLRGGGRLRLTSTADSGTQGFNGTFTFSSLDVFALTERGLQAGWTPAQIRAAGGGASQFAMVAGQPGLSGTMVDVGLFVQDDWRLRPNLTISAGLRCETQNDIRRRANLAPRAAVAWSPGPTRKGVAPRWVIRSGFGIFYDRFPQALALQAERLDGTHTQQFVVPSPDFYPFVPAVTTLAAARLTPTIYRVDPDLRAPETLQTGATVERKVGKTSSIAVSYLYSHGVNQLLSRSLSASVSPSAVPAYEFESAGTFNQHQLTANFALRPAAWLSLNGFYVLGSARGDTSGAASFPSNPLDLSADYGRMTFDVRHHLTLFAGIDLPGFRVVPFVVASSGQPFDMTVGRDLNGDSIFNDRPAFATDLARPSVVLTRFGAFDTAPMAGQTIIPRNLGVGPAHVELNLRVTKPFVVREHDTIRVDLVAVNLLNYVNAGPPVGNLGSPLFGHSTGLAGTLSQSANRKVHLQLQFLF